MNVFVIWDLTSPGIRTLLEAVPELFTQHEGRRITWQIPGVTLGGRQLARDVIHRGIHAADHVIALLERPSPSVGWQVGLALGWQRSLQLAFVGESLPAWTQTGVLKGLFAHRLHDIAGVQQLLAPLPWEFAAATPDAASTSRLLLCDRGPIGSTLREVARKEVPGITVPPDDGWGLYEVPGLLGGHRGLLWVIGGGGDGSGDGGGELAANGVVAGFAEARGFEVAVLRSSDAPAVPDVQPRERCFRSLTEFKQKLLGTSTALPATRPPPPGSDPARDGAVSPAAAHAAPVAAEKRRSRAAVWLAAPLLLVGGIAAFVLLHRAPAASAPSSVPDAAAPPDLSPRVVVAKGPVPAAPAEAARPRRHGSKPRPDTPGAPGRVDLTLPGVTVRFDGVPLDPTGMTPAAVPTESDPADSPPAPAPAPAPSPRPAREGPSRSRASQGSCAISDGELDEVIKKMRKEWTSSERNGVMQTALRSRCLTAEQAKQLLGHCRSSFERMDVVRCVGPRLVDPENASLVYGALLSRFDRDEARKIIEGGAQPE